MVASAYHLGACASVAGTIIGLLFVATSLSPHRDIGRRAPWSFQVQAGVAFTTLIDALVIALAALLPGTNLGTAVASRSPHLGDCRRCCWTEKTSVRCWTSF
jgi:hypothetical protein